MPKVPTVYLTSFLVLVSTIAGIFICEAALEHFPRLLAPSSTELVWDHWTFGRNWSDGQREYNARYEFDDYVGYVRPGLITAANSFQRSPGKYYAVFLGDSLTEGSSTYAGQIGKIFSDQLPTFSWQGINLGTTGYDTVMEARLLERYALQIHPDLIVLQFCLNDFNSTPVIAQNADGKWMAYHAGSLTPWISPRLFALSRTYQLLAVTAMRLLETSQSRQSRNDKVRKSLAAIAKMAEKNKIPLRILVFPYLGVEDPRLQDIRNLVSELGLSSVTIDLESKYQGFMPATLRANPEDPVHPSKEGHRIAAEALFENLKATLKLGP